MIKTIDINALEWFDRINGNPYFAANVTVNYGMADAQTVKIPFQYGYGDHYKDVAFQKLQDSGIIPKQPEMSVFWRYCDENGIILRATKQTGCKKRELLSL